MDCLFGLAHHNPTSAPTSLDHHNSPTFSSCCRLTPSTSHCSSECLVLLELLSRQSPNRSEFLLSSNLHSEVDPISKLNQKNRRGYLDENRFSLQPKFDCDSDQDLLQNISDPLQSVSTQILACSNPRLEMICNLVFGISLALYPNSLAVSPIRPL